MKKIISLMLCLLMLVPMFASCSKEEEEDIVETATREAVTIGMYVITEEETKPEAAQAVADAIKSLVRSKYTTNVEIIFLTEENYYETIETRLAAMKVEAEKAKATQGVKDETADENEAVTTEATIVNEYGVTELKYPDLGANQVDLFMIADYDKYVQLAEGGWLYKLDDTLKNTSKKLTDYIYPSILEASKVNGGYYAVPTNKPIGGESTFMIIDKALAKEFGLKVNQISSFYDEDLADFFGWIADNKADVTPIAGSFDKLNATYMNYKNRELNNDFSLVGIYGEGEITEAKSLFADANYKNDLLYLAELYYSGAFGSAKSEKFAAAIKTGDINDMSEYAKDYEIIVIDSESAPANELCSSMFAVSKYTSEFNRVMEVVTLLNTSSELRNLLQYGIEDVNYERDAATGALTMLNNDYSMDLYKTGNVYMAYPDEGMPANIWEMAKKQNLASGVYAEDAFGGFTVPANTPEVRDPETNEVTKKAFTLDDSAAKALANASAELSKSLKAAKTFEDFKAIVEGASEKYADVIDQFLSKSNASSVYALYLAK